jgi:threonine dehydratase
MKKRLQKVSDVALSDIQEAKKQLQRFLRPTPLVHNPWLSQAFGCDVFLKLESMQPIGSFKIRGATYKISQLTPRQRKQGVIAASAGNHAQGVAYGAQIAGSHALIVMPETASLLKIQNTQALGAEVILQGQTYDEAYLAARALSRKTGRLFVHAFEDPLVIAGQGTVGLEILDQLPEVDGVIASVGGGGLLAGVSIALKALKPEVEMVGCQAAAAPSMIESIRARKAVQLESAQTFADGIAVLKASDFMRKILSRSVDHWVEVEEDELAVALLLLVEKAKLIAEGSCAAPLAALSQLRKRFQGKKIVLIVSGGNIDVNLLARVMDRGLVRTGRRLRINAWMLDRPGSLVKVTEVLSRLGCNVLQIIHDRDRPSLPFGQAQVELTLETKGLEHCAQLLEALQKVVVRLETQ